MSRQIDLFEQDDVDSERGKGREVHEEGESPLLYFDHPYPRFGVAYTLFFKRVPPNDRERIESILEDDQKFAQMAAEVIADALGYIRLVAEEAGEERRFRHVPSDQLETSGQTTGNGYYLAPHIATEEGGRQQSDNRLIKKMRVFRDRLQKGEGLREGQDLQRPFSPFSAQTNRGKSGYVKSLSNPEVSFLHAAFTLIATIARYKPAARVPHPPFGKTDYCNQVIIPDLDIPCLIDFIDLFKRVQDQEMGSIFGATNSGRPEMDRGNYPDAPPRHAFGPVGVMAAMGKWAQRAQGVEWAQEVLKEIPKHPLYLVSNEKSLLRQVHIGEHVSRLAQQPRFSQALMALYHADHHNQDDNEYGSNKRDLFREMTGRFLQSYTKPSFRDFLSFRVQYEVPFSIILEDYFMNHCELPEDVVRSALEYGRYLNRQAWEAGQKEAQKENSKRSPEEAKTKVLNQMESTIMSADTATEIFARLNREARQIDHFDAPSGAQRFMEAAVTGRVVGEAFELDTVRELIRAFMRIRTEGQNSGDSTNEGSPTE